LYFSANQTTSYVEEALQKLFVEGLCKNVDEKCNDQLGEDFPLVDESALCAMVTDTEETAKAFSENDTTKLDELVSLSFVGHSLSKYISMLPDVHRKHILTSIISQTVNWISQIFR